MPDNITIVPIGRKKCKPFILEVMVFAPEAGFKFEVSVEKSCTPTAEPVWKLVFDLYKRKLGGEFDQIVHVSYTADTPKEAQVIEATAVNGLSPTQADVLVNKVHPATKDLETAGSMPAAELEKRKKKVKDALKKVANAVDVDL